MPPQGLNFLSAPASRLHERLDAEPLEQRTEKRQDVLLDDGSLVGFDGNAFERSGLRLLRLGQRVRMQIGGAGDVEWLTISTLPDPTD